MDSAVERIDKKHKASNDVKIFFHDEMEVEIKIIFLSRICTQHNVVKVLIVNVCN